MSNQIIPGLGGLFKPKELIEAAGSIIDNLHTSKEEKEKAKLEVAKEVNRHAEEVAKNETEALKAHFANTDSARNREIETTRAGSTNIIQASLALVAVAFFCLLVVYVVVKGLKEMDENEAFLVGSLLSMAGSMALSVMNYYFGSSAGSANKDNMIKKLSK